MNYDEMSIDELYAAGRLRTLADRRSARDAILDLAEALDAEGLVVVPEIIMEAVSDVIDRADQYFPDPDDYEWSSGVSDGMDMLADVLRDAIHKTTLVGAE